MAAPVTLPFARSERSTVGLEWEVALVDADSGDLRQAAQSIFDAVRPADGSDHPSIKQELLLNTVEVSSGVCRTVGQAGEDLRRALDEVAAAAEPLRIQLMGGGTHPFANWAQQKVSDKQRYATLIDRTQWWGRQMLIFGVHVHVGIEDRDKVLPLSRAMLTVFPHLQSLSASSPFWGGKDTGYASNRALLFQQLPTAGLPFGFARWEELEQYVGDMLHTGVIDQFDEVRWDIRPAPRFGTLEMRIADGATNLLEVTAISALTHCLVEHFSTMLDRGETLPTMPPWFAQENKWRSARYGMDAIIITNAAGDEELVTDAVSRWLVELAPVAERLGCSEELDQVRVVLRRGASYQRQRAVARRNAGELDAVVRSLVAEMAAGRPL
ncbi:glutamate--cysteine ligase [Cellulomonas fimi]|uniref:Putative glutamate--cysteine ligase 2 n=1 Tax=Cellulomonas fimi (strain ATCC 484 / DSM 20113 / JCM 1341 / CCUG 24087 / LMG 16345 / NBRC 15513 / NCIMB 8980 / NCTC 7547 / NRS-133) TaxID=590998 RepID=F4H234_CELFA|nr:glutamate--cysteine ligase [Cellulomonas fimi]AEE45204.1 glutamate--cysteine ligase GCS2 [Cellulomonas fimi ATCC 484]NNH07130.1 glutamate--cysteine ligase [Cellulomonas fimi]VEH28559.1 Carboxylate-amine ligase YbdK [Cellulomonas fimi]